MNDDYQTSGTSESFSEYSVSSSEDTSETSEVLENSSEETSEESSELTSENSSEEGSEEYTSTIVYNLDENVVNDIHNIELNTLACVAFLGTFFFIWIIGVVYKELNRFF